MWATRGNPSIEHIRALYQSSAAISWLTQRELIHGPIASGRGLCAINTTVPCHRHNFLRRYFVLLDSAAYLTAADEAIVRNNSRRPASASCIFTYETSWQSSTQVFQLSIHVPKDAVFRMPLPRSSMRVRARDITVNVSCQISILSWTDDQERADIVSSYLSEPECQGE